MGLRREFTDAIDQAIETGNSRLLNQVITGPEDERSETAQTYARTLVENGCVRNDQIVVLDMAEHAANPGLAGLVRHDEKIKSAFEQAAGGVIILDGIQSVEPLLSHINESFGSCVMVLVGDEKGLGAFHDKNDPLQTRFPSRMNLGKGR